MAGESQGQLGSPDPLTADFNTYRHISSHTETPNTFQAAVSLDEEGWDMDGEFEMEDYEFAPGYMAYGMKDGQCNPGGILSGPTAFENSSPAEDLHMEGDHVQNDNTNNNLHSPAALETSNPGPSLDLESESAPAIVKTPKSTKTLETEYHTTPTATAGIADESINIQPSRRAESLGVEDDLAMDLDNGFNPRPSTSINSAPGISMSHLSTEDISSDSSNDSGSDSDTSLDAYERPMKAQAHAAETEATTASSSKGLSSKPKKRNPLTTTPPPPTTRHPGIAAHKRALPPTGPLDATDTLIMTLKGGGHSDKAVAAALVARGLHAYDPKSISTRHRRIREARAAETDRALRLRRRRWTAAEDEALVGAYLGALRRQDDEGRGRGGRGEGCGELLFGGGVRGAV
ncbi:hypothetical protein SLS56_001765 [Neofusicoccum ribis]|uniref:DUF7626 domain-containing protein n=1 Tax=Neofusicoccum ribis TaxID=45134 RepID=A0ABR3T761_9PEZI